MYRSVPILGLAFAILGLALGRPADVRAQVAWEAPMMLAPGAPAGVSLLLLDPHPTSKLAGVITYRPQSAPGGTGWRAGVTEDAFDGVSLFGGIDFSGPWIQAAGEVPVDVIWVAGVGAGYADGVVDIGVPLGISAGRVLDTRSTRFIPYIAPRAVLNARVGGDDPESEGFTREDVSVDLTVDIGIDIGVSNRTMLRFAASVGDRGAAALGLHIGRVR